MELSVSLVRVVLVVVAALNLIFSVALILFRNWLAGFVDRYQAIAPKELEVNGGGWTLGGLVRGFLIFCGIMGVIFSVIIVVVGFSATS